MITNFDHCPMVADGVVVFNMNDDRAMMAETRPSHGMIGLDAHTGRELWRVPQCLGVWCSPMRWVHEGKTYAIGACKDSAVAVEVHSGKILWRVPGNYVLKAGFATGEGYLVTGGNVDKDLSALTRHHSSSIVSTLVTAQVAVRSGRLPESGWRDDQGQARGRGSRGVGCRHEGVAEEDALEGIQGLFASQVLSKVL